MNKTIVLPVTVGKRDVLLKSVDSIFELSDDTIRITARYKYEAPKDKDDEFSPIEQRLIDYNCVAKKESITAISYNWDSSAGCYEIEILLGSMAYPHNIASREEAIRIHALLTDWWLE